MAGEEEYDEDSSEEDEDEEVVGERQGEVKGEWRDSWAATAAGAGGPTSPVLETHFGFAEELAESEGGEKMGAGSGFSTVREVVHGFEEEDGLGTFHPFTSHRIVPLFIAQARLKLTPLRTLLLTYLGPLSKTSSSSFLAFLPSPTGSFQHVEHEDTLLRTYSSTHLALEETRLTEQEMKEARVIEHGGHIGVGGGWRDWIGV